MKSQSAFLALLAVLALVKSLPSSVLFAKQFKKRSAISVNGNKAALRRALWDKTQLTYSLHGQMSSNGQTRYDVVERALNEAFREWAHNSCFTFIKVDATASPLSQATNSDIRIVFTNDREINSPRPVDNVRNHSGTCDRRFRYSAAHAFFRTHSTFPAQVHVNNEIFWIESTKMPGSVSLKTVLLHEIGHVLGLVHSSNVDSVMYEFIYTNKVKRVTGTDRKNLEKIYGFNC
jgi:predicted Zn-dependent protease